MSVKKPAALSCLYNVSACWLRIISKWKACPHIPVNFYWIKLSLQVHRILELGWTCKQYELERASTIGRFVVMWHIEDTIMALVVLKQYISILYVLDRVLSRTIYSSGLLKYLVWEMRNQMSFQGNYTFVKTYWRSTLYVSVPAEI